MRSTISCVQLGPTHQKQIGDVRTGDQQEQPDRREEQPQRLARGADGTIVQRRQPKPLAIVPTVLEKQRLADRVDVRRRRRECDAIGEPTDHRHRRVVAIAQHAAQTTERKPKRRLLLIDGSGSAEPGRHHPNHRVRHAVERDDATDGGCLPAKPTLPELV